MLEETIPSFVPEPSKLATEQKIMMDRQKLERVEIRERSDSISKKRDHYEAFPSEEELAHMSKPERKRHREKRRRDRVNASFDELRALMIRVDPECSNRMDISQLELIDRSIVVIKGLVNELSKNRQQLRELEGIAAENDKVNLAIPFVNPFENENQIVGQHEMFHSTEPFQPHFQPLEPLSVFAPQVREQQNPSHPNSMQITPSSTGQQHPQLQISDNATGPTQPFNILPSPIVHQGALINHRRGHAIKTTWGVHSPHEIPHKEGDREN